MIDGLQGEPNSERYIIYRNRYNENGHLIGMEAVQEWKTERKTGKWNKDGFCTVCRKEAITEWNDCGGETAFTKFCPNCGARMET